MSFSSLPLDVLLVVLRDLDVVDIVRTGMTCRDLYGIVEDRHIWIDQLEKLYRKGPALRCATPPLTSLSAQELKSFVTGRVKLLLRWDKGDNENGFATEHLIGIPGERQLRLLPGGKSVLVINNYGGVALHRIEFKGSQVFLPLVANINLKCDQEAIVMARRSELLVAMSPCPIFIHRLGNNIYLVEVDHHNGAMSLATTFPIPEGCGSLEAHGQGRVVGFLIPRPHGSLWAVVIHLDYPGVSMEFKIPPAYTVGAGPTNIRIPTESLVVIYNTRHSLAYEILNFSHLPPGVHLSRRTPMWYWSGPGRPDDYTELSLNYMASEALYDPPSTQEFNLHYLHYDYKTRDGMARIFVVTITITINAKNNFVSESIEPPTLRKKSTLVRGHGPGSFRLFRKGLHAGMDFHDDKLDILATPLDDLGLEGGRGALRMTVPYKILRDCAIPVEMDMDEATGRVVVWTWDPDAHETRIFLGDLV